MMNPRQLKKDSSNQNLKTESMTKHLLPFFLLFPVFFNLNAQNPIGNGTDGDLTVQSGTTFYTDQVHTSVVGSNIAGTNKLFVKSATSFKVGDEVLIITMQDPQKDLSINRVGTYETKTISSISGNTFTFPDNLWNDYDTVLRKKHQVIKVLNFANVIINGTISCSAWDGETGGVLFFRANGTVTASGTGKISATGKGYRGGRPNSYGQFLTGYSGESYLLYPTALSINYKDINGGGGASGDPRNASGSNVDGTGGGGGASYGTEGAPGAINWAGAMGGLAGTLYGDAQLSKVYMGSGGGGTGVDDNYGNYGASGGNGGGIIMVYSSSFENIPIESNGANGNTPADNSSSQRGGSGAGSGGSIIVNAASVTNNASTKILATGGKGAPGISQGGAGGDGGNGRIRINYHTFNNTGVISPVPYEGAFHVIIVHTMLQNTMNISSPYPVNAYIYDNFGHAITNAKVYYRIDGGAFSAVSMTSSDNILFTGNIPAQVANKQIDYYISVVEGATQYNFPQNAPGKLFAFKITGELPKMPILNCDNSGIVTVKWKSISNTTNFVDYSVYRSETANFVPDNSNCIVLHTSDTSYVNNKLQDAHTYYYIVSANYLIGGIAAKAFSPQTSIVSNNTSLTTVQGYANLEGQSNHAGIKVRFNPISPSAVLDSTYTNALGYYQKAINPGLYSISYEKTFFATYSSPSISFIDDKNMGITQVYSIEGGAYSGNVKGVWNKNYYGLVGDVTVQTGDTLIIKAGSKIRSYGNFNFTVNGYLAIEGAKNDTVYISRGYADKTPLWHGIDINDAANDNSHLDYAVVEYAEDGLWVINATPTVSNCKFRYNSNSGIFFRDNANMKVSNVEICGNSTYGMYIRDYAKPVMDNIYIHNVARGIETNTYAAFTLTNSNISNNTNYGMVTYYSYPVLKNSTFSNNVYNGLYFDSYSSVKVENCNISNNTYYGINFENYNTGYISNCQINDNIQGGIRCRYNDNVRFSANKINNNSGPGVFIEYYYHTILIDHNQISGNTDGILKDSYTNTTNTFVIKYNTIYGNKSDGIERNGSNSGSDTITNNIIVNNAGYGLLNNDVIESLKYNNIYGNTLGEISTLTNVPIDTWKMVSYNANHDEADVYLNFSEEPSFINPGTANFILRPESKCINAGSPLEKDPDGTVSDVGAIYRDLGNPHKINVTGYADKTVSLGWEKVTLDSLIRYKVYYKLDTASTYTYFANTVDSFINVTGLTNAKVYNFTVTGVFPSYESGYAPKVSGIPGTPMITLNPVAMIVNVPAATDTLRQDLTVSNPGSRPLNIRLLNQASYTNFDGTGDLISAGNPAQLSNFNAFTLEAWIRRTGNGHFEFMGKHYTQYSVYVDGNNYLGIYKGYSNTYQGFTSNYYLPVGEWHHVAVTWSGSVITFYVDGIKKQEVTGAASSIIPANSYNFQIGRRADQDSYYLNGDLAEVRVWNIARSENEIASTVNTNLSGKEPGLVGYWPLTSDFNDHSIYSVSGSVSGNVSLIKKSYKGGNIIIDNTVFTIQPGGSINIPLKFPKKSVANRFFTIPIFTDVLTKPQINYEITVTYGQKVPSTTVHFKPVTPTGLPYTLVITEAKVDNAAIQIGDEIGVFDNNICVGSGLFDGTYNFSMTAWKADVSQGLPGFTEGHPMVFKIYDASADKEATATAKYAIGNGNFGYGQFSVLNLTGTIYKIQNVPVKQGMFTLVSFNQLPKQPGAANVFNKLTGLKIAYDDHGSAFIPDYDINSIGDIDFRKGYHVFSTKADTIKFEGTTIDPSLWDVSVETRKWNSIGYLGSVPTDVTKAFPANMVDSISIIQTYDGSAWIPSLSVNTIGDLKPGWGYQIALNSKNNIKFKYQVSAVKSTLIKQSALIPQNFKYDITGLPYTVVMDLPEAQNFIEKGDEIALFDKTKCVGASVYMGETRINIPAWEGNADYGLNGFTGGDSIYVKVYKSKDKQQLDAVILSSITGEDLLFKGKSYAYLKIAGLSTLPKEETLYQLYPNPCKEKLVVEYVLEKDGQVSLTLTDLSGRVIASYTSAYQIAGHYNYTLDLSKVSPGSYLFKLETTSKLIIKKKIIRLN
jgi:hypothetical protein